VDRVCRERRRRSPLRVPYRALDWPDPHDPRRTISITIESGYIRTACLFFRNSKWPPLRTRLSPLKKVPAEKFALKIAQGLAGGKSKLANGTVPWYWIFCGFVLRLYECRAFFVLRQCYTMKDEDYGEHRNATSAGHLLIMLQAVNLRYWSDKCDNGREIAFTFITRGALP